MKIFKVLASVTLAAIAIGWGSPFSEAATIRVDHAKIKMNLSKGESQSGQIRLSNPTNESLDVRVYSEDWAYKTTGDGDKDFFPAGTLEDSATPWISFSPKEVTLSPFGQAPVNYTLTVPKSDVRGGYQSVLFFETLIGQTANTEGANVLVSGRIGALFFVEITGTMDRSGKVERLKVTPPIENQPVRMELTYSNTGNVLQILDGEFLIMDTNGLVKGRGEMTPMYLPARSTATTQTEWTGKLNPGSYDVVVTLNLGDGKAMVEEAKMVVKG